MSSFSGDTSLPRSIEAEQVVLGSLMSSPNECLPLVQKDLKKEMFYRKSHQEIYGAITGLSNAEIPVTIASVVDYLKHKVDSLEDIGGVATVSELKEHATKYDEYEFMVKMVRDKYLLRRLSMLGQNIEELASESEGVETAIQEATALLDDLTVDSIVSSEEKARDLVISAVERLQDRMNKKNLGISAGFRGYDDNTGGYQKGQLIIVGARPAMGKTTWALNSASFVAEFYHLPVVIFSLEMTKEQLIDRVICAKAGLDGLKCKKGLFNEKEVNTFKEGARVIARLPLLIDDNANINVEAIRAKCKLIKRKVGPIGLVVVDYIQLIEGRSGGVDMTRDVSHISRNLKVLARELDTTVLALSQLSRAVEMRKDKRPMLSDLRESGSLEQDADVVMFLYRHEYYNPDCGADKGKADGIMAKVREGTPNTFKMIFRSSWTRFMDIIDINKGRINR